MRCKGRLNNSPLPENSRKPILLLASHEFVQLLIKQSHESVQHSGIRDTPDNNKGTFLGATWTRSREEIIRKRVMCRKYEGMPYSPQPSNYPPDERVFEDPSFTNVGFNFVGPLFIETKSPEVERNESKKVGICLFTCASTRAVHLELCRSRREYPQVLHRITPKRSSLWAQKYARLHDQTNFDATKEFPGISSLERPRGGKVFWGTLVRSIKRPLKKVLGRSTRNFEELRIVLVEIESVINTRLITYIYDNADSISYHLTPSDRIYGRRTSSIPNSAHYEIISTYKPLTRRARHYKSLLQQSTKKWRREHLTSLREQSSVRNKGNDAQDISIGDVVLLKSDSTTRCYWKLAKVEELIPGIDGRVRVAVFKTTSRDKRPVYLRSVVQHLIPTEVKAINEVTHSTQPVVIQPADQVVRDNIVRPRRTAAAVGEINRQLNSS